MTQAKIAHDKNHGSPYDRGSADKYYGRNPVPHYHEYSAAAGGRQVIDEKRMSTEQVAAYWAGYEQETDRKDWGK